jgi:hypothetical protein
MKLGFEGAAEVEAEWWRRRTYFPRSSASPFFFFLSNTVFLFQLFLFHFVLFIVSGIVKVVYI